MRRWLVVVGLLLVVSTVISAQVLSYSKISESSGGFTGMLDPGDLFGGSMSAIGDLDDDGVVDLAVSCWADDDGGTERGAVWILFLNPDGTVKSHQKISDTEGGFTGELNDVDRFGSGSMGLGDFDGDGVEDIVVGASLDDDGGTNRGAVWILFLNTDGTVKLHQKISDTEGGFTGVLDDGDRFGSGQCVGYLGDLDDDGIPDFSVGARYDDDGGTDRGAVYVLFMNSDGTVKSHQKISSTAGGFNGDLEDGDRLGVGGAAIGDVSGDGIVDIAYGAYLDDDGNTNAGAIWILFLNKDGTVNGHQKISNTEGGFTGSWNEEDQLGRSIEALGDLDGNGVGDIALGIWGHDDGGTDRGSVWFLFLEQGGTVISHTKISDTEGGFDAEIEDEDRFGTAVAVLGDLDGNGLHDIAVGAGLDDDGGLDQGAVYVLSIDYEYASATINNEIDSLYQAVPAEGDTFPFEIAIVNNVQDTLEVEYWTRVFNAEGTPIGAVFGPYNLELKPFESFATTDTLPVPSDATPGVYDLISYVGTLGVDTIDTDIANFEKLSPTSTEKDIVIEIAIDSMFLPVPAAGDSFPYSLTFTNNSDDTLVFELWVDLLQPNGNVSGVLGSKTPVLIPGGSRTKGPFLEIPANRTAGDYSLIVNWIANPGGTADDTCQASVDFEKLAAGESIAPGNSVELEGAPQEFALEPNYPNPFNPSTTIRYALPEASDVTLTIYDITGRKVKQLAMENQQSAGYHSVVWDGTNEAGIQVASGIYFYQLTANAERSTNNALVQTRKMLLTK